jgi:ankyrin repeat protein
LDVAKFLIEKWDADMSLISKNDENCLMIAARVRDEFTTDFLCRYYRDKFNIDYECRRNGLTAFTRAVLSGYYDIADILFKVGRANPDYISKREGKSIIDMIIASKNTPAIDYVVNLRDLKLSDDQLQRALINKDLDMIRKSNI